MVHESPKKQRAEFPQNVSITIYKVGNITLTITFFLWLKSVGFVSLYVSKVSHKINNVYLRIIKLDAINKNTCNANIVFLTTLKY